MATKAERAKASRLKRKIKLAALEQVRDNLFYYGSLSEEQQEQISEQFQGIITEYESGMEAAEEALLADVDASIRDVVQTYGYDVALAAIGDHGFSFVAYNPDLRKMVDENSEFGYQNITGQTQEEVMQMADSLAATATVDEWGNVQFPEDEDGEDDESEPRQPQANGRCRVCENPLLADGKCAFINHAGPAIKC
jgi:hypothetical protein